MNTDLNDSTKNIARALIDLSDMLSHKMDRWDVITNGDGALQNTELAGFVNKTSADRGIDLVIDIHALNDDSEGVLRTWALDSVINDDGAKVFNNIQLTFAVDYKKARKLTERYDTVTREDIRALLREPDTAVQEVVISNHSGLGEATQRRQGEYYDVSADEIVEQGIIKELCDTLDTVLNTLQHAADVEQR